jgi:hypothetical protein
MNMVKLLSVSAIILAMMVFLVISKPLWTEEHFVIPAMTKDKVEIYVAIKAKQYRKHCLRTIVQSTILDWDMGIYNDSEPALAVLIYDKVNDHCGTEIKEIGFWQKYITARFGK